eukprot:727249-Hanusia_phi.AAC.1
MMQNLLQVMLVLLQLNHVHCLLFPANMPAGLHLLAPHTLTCSSSRHEGWRRRAGEWEKTACSSELQPSLEQQGKFVKMRKTSYPKDVVLPRRSVSRMARERLEQTDKKHISTRSAQVVERREHGRQQAAAGVAIGAMAMLQRNFTGKEELLRLRAQAWEEVVLLKDAYWLIGGQPRPPPRRRAVLAMQVKREGELYKYLSSMLDVLQEKPLAQLDASSESFRSSWRRGPGALLGLLLRTSMIVSGFFFVSFILLLQLSIVAVRTSMWILLWGMDYGNRREWWIPELVEGVMWIRDEMRAGSLSKQVRESFEEGKKVTRSSVLFLRGRQRAGGRGETGGEETWESEGSSARRVDCGARRLSLFSPEIQSKFIHFASSAKSRGREYVKNLRSKMLEVKDLVEEDRGAAQGGGGGGGGGGWGGPTAGRNSSRTSSSGQVDFASKLEDARRASEARMTRRLGFEPLREAVNISSWERAEDINLTEVEDGSHLERTSKRSMTMRLLKNMSAAVSNSVSAGISMTFNFTPPDVGNVSGEVLGAASSFLATAGNIASDLGMGQWQANLTSWLGKSGRQEQNTSPWQQMLSGISEGTSSALSSLQSSIGGLDQSLMLAVDATEMAMSKALTQTTVALPWLQSAEDWVRG